MGAVHKSSVIQLKNVAHTAVSSTLCRRTGRGQGRPMLSDFEAHAAIIADVVNKMYIGLERQRTAGW